MKKITLVLSLLISTLGFGQNLITNGDFETGEVAPWEGYKNQVVTDDLTSSLSGNINNGDGSLYQSFAVTAGTTYSATFHYRWVGSGGTALTARVKSGATDGDDLGTFDLNTTTDTWYSDGAISFTVPDGITTARIIFNKDNGNRPLRFDNVSVIIDATAFVEDFAKFNFSHYPNPTTNNLNISASENIEKIEIFNLIGQKVISSLPNINKTKVNVSSLNTGIYIMKATIDGVTGSFKFIKE